LAVTAFRGWWIVAVAFVAQGIAIGLTIIPYGLFLTSITEEFGASVAEYQTGIAILTLVMTGCGSFVGRLLDRGSIRVIMTCGSVLLACSFFGMSLATELWQLGLGFGLGAAIGVATAGPLAATTVVAKWFERKRGQAVGIATLGIPAAGLALTPLAGQLLDALGWRATLQAFGGISLLIPPLAMLVVRNTPEAIGQRVDGEARTAGVPDLPPGEPASAGEIFGNLNFWALALGVGIVFGLGSGWNANVVRFGEDLGYTITHMSTLIGIAAGLGAPATLLFGALADRFDNRALLVLGIVGQTTAMALLWTLPAELGFTVAMLLFGFAGGTLMPVYAAFIGRLFGAASFGSVMGLAGLVMLPFGAGAPVLAGALRDASGSYASTLLWFTVAFVVGASLLMLIRQPAAAES
jgi:MFS family permease